MKKRKPSLLALDRQDIIYSFLGAFLFGVIFLVSGSVLDQAKQFSLQNTLLVLAVTILILCFKVYVNSYRKLKIAHDVTFFEVLAARLIAYAAITFAVTVYILYIFSPLLSGSFTDVLKLGIMISFPAAIGSILPVLMKEF